MREREHSACMEVKVYRKSIARRRAYRNTLDGTGNNELRFMERNNMEAVVDGNPACVPDPVYVVDVVDVVAEILYWIEFA